MYAYPVLIFIYGASKFLNIDYLHSTIHRWKGLIDNFEEAEKQLYVNPVLSIISSRRAMEWLVKDIYKSNCDYYDINLPVFEMINEQTFIDCIKNKDFLTRCTMYVRLVILLHTVVSQHLPRPLKY